MGRSLAGTVLGSARIRTVNDDFRVEEVLPFEPAGRGEHLFLTVRKDGWNTSSAVRWIARALSCRERDVGFCGHKDRYAVTVQSFTVPSRVEPEAAAAFDWPDGLTLVRAQRHDRKLRRGVHRANRFSIRLRDVDADPAAVDARLAAIREGGFPNRFGEQRFGRDGENVSRARASLSRKNYRRSRDPGHSVEISALRSMLFNAVLSARIEEGTWRSALPGDLMLLDGSRSFFVADRHDATLAARIADGDVHPSGPLWGRGAEKLPPELLGRERGWLSPYRSDCELLEARGFALERRPLRALARDLAWRWPDAGVLALQFVLDRGCYATALLGEVFDLRELQSERC